MAMSNKQRIDILSEIIRRMPAHLENNEIGKWIDEEFYFHNFQSNIIDKNTDIEEPLKLSRPTMGFFSSNLDN